MKLDCRALTTCEVSADGRAVSVGFIDTNGQTSAVQFSLDQVGALAMTLPGLIEKALRLQFSDESLRYSYPLGSWKFEQTSDPRSSIVTLSTTDGFSVCFSMKGNQRSELGDALEDVTTPPSIPLPN